MYSQKIKDNPYIESVLKYVKTKFADDIDIVTLYGSFLRGDTHKKSDIDLFFVPANSHGVEATFTAIVDDIGYDFFPISWDRLTRIADYKEGLTSLLTDGEVIYYRNEQVLEKYLNLKLSCQQKKNLASQAKKKLAKAKELFFDYNNLPELLGNLIEAVCLFNNTVIKKGFANFENELKDKLQPNDFIERIKKIIANPDKNLTRELIVDTELFVLKKENLYHDLETGFYEELKSIYQKALVTEDLYKQFFTKAIIDREIEAIFGKDNHFPKLQSNYKEWINLHEKYLLEEIKKRDIKINSFKDIEAFRQKMLRL